MDRQVTDFNIRLRTIKLREFLVGIILSIIFSGILMGIFPVLYDNDDLFLITFLSIVFLFFVWALKGTTGLTKNFQDIFLKKNRNEILYVFAINLIFAFWFLFIVVILDFTMGMLDPTWITGLDIDSIDLTPSKFLLSCITTIIVAPVMEELIFRGILFNRLKIRTGIVPAMIVSSVLFAIGHDFGGILSAFIFGICMCILYLKTDNILIPMSVHFLNNLVVTLLSIINIDAFLSQFPQASILGILVGISIILLMIYIINETTALKKANS